MLQLRLCLGLGGLVDGWAASAAAVGAGNRVDLSGIRVDCTKLAVTVRLVSGAGLGMAEADVQGRWQAYSDERCLDLRATKGTVRSTMRPA